MGTIPNMPRLPGLVGPEGLQTNLGSPSTSPVFPGGSTPGMAVRGSGSMGLSPDQMSMLGLDPTSLFWLQQFGINPSSIIKAGLNPSTATGGLTGFTAGPILGPNSTYGQVGPIPSVPSNFGYDPASFQPSLRALGNMGDYMAGQASQPFVPNTSVEDAMTQGARTPLMQPTSGGGLVDPQAVPTGATLAQPVRMADITGQAQEYTTEQQALADMMTKGVGARNAIGAQMQDLATSQQRAQNEALQQQFGLVGERAGLVGKEQALAGEQQGLIGAAQGLAGDRQGIVRALQGLTSDQLNILRERLGLKRQEQEQANQTGDILGKLLGTGAMVGMAFL